MNTHDLPDQDQPGDRRTVKPAKPCQIWERRVPYRTIVSCDCGWLKSVFHRNALARASLARSVGEDHVKKQAAR